MRLSEILDTAELSKAIDQKYVRCSKHPELPLRVFSYTQKAMYDNVWTPVTRQCRGLVTGPTDEIVGWCMPKFFNIHEHITGSLSWAQQLPNEPFQIFAKVDGSLGTVFHAEGRWRVATRGGFQSPQAQWAQRWLNGHLLAELNPHNTYVTEIIYPENRIVVDYGTLTTMTLLAVYGNNGQEKSLHGHGEVWQRLGGTLIREYPTSKLSSLQFYARRNEDISGEPVEGTKAEGYVLRYASGVRVKLKFPDYVRMHGIVTGLSERHIWQLMRDGRSLSTLLDVLPAEYHSWVEATSRRLAQEFHTSAVDLAGRLIESNLPHDPREFQKFAEAQPTAAALFHLYDQLSQHTWDSIEPGATGPWKDRE